ncbi:hypothetical protein [Luteimicrobium album]|uniref:hypothetical protein n=1 Tax=Luteimicrobium album TaxID=1054550 RepID=UPI0024E14C2D|nr:hypothetical protein [Luteimicrobium album]
MASTRASEPMMLIVVRGPTSPSARASLPSIGPMGMVAATLSGLVTVTRPQSSVVRSGLIRRAVPAPGVSTSNGMPTAVARAAML